MNTKSTSFKIFAAVGAVIVLAALIVAAQMTTKTAGDLSSVTQLTVSEDAKPGPQPITSDQVMGSSGVETMEAPARGEIGIPTPPPPTAGKTAAEAEQRIIKTGYLSLVVNSVNDTVQRIEELTNEMNGFVQSSSVSERDDGTHDGSMTVRVPVDNMETAMEDIKTLANVVETERVTGQDVTEQYTDLEARLENARSQEERYRELLDQAEDVQDILSIEQQLNQIRNEIEHLEGRLQSLENRTSYSTININLSEEPKVQAPTKTFRPLTSVNEAVQALIEFGQQFVIGLIWVAIVGGGIAIPIALVGWVAYKIYKAIKQRNA
jgi:archaellum component FlaC